MLRLAIAGLTLSALGVSSFAQTPATPAAGAPAKTAAAAPTPPPRTTDEEDVTVLDAVVAVGRFHDRTVLNSPVPIDSISASEIRGTGYTETNQAMQMLVPSFNFPRPSNTDGTDHIRPATIRALAPDHTLILVNGKRRHTSALVNVNGSVGRGSVSVDMNAFPPTSSGGIEVLRDGAAAQYGSDAIAGVIDVKLRRDIGYELSVTAGETYQGDGDVIETAFDAGARAGSTGFVHVSSYFRHRDQTNRTGKDVRQQFFITRGGNPAVASVVQTNINNSPVYLPTDILDPREATINRRTSSLGDSDSKEMGVLVNSEIALGKSVKGYGFGGYTHRDSRSAATWRRPLDNNNVRAIHPDGFLPHIEAGVTDSSITLGAKDLTKDWTWDLSQTFGGNTVKYDVDNTVNATLGTASPKRFYSGELSFRQATTNLDLTHQFDFGWNAPVRVAVGGEYRWENYRIRAGHPDSYRNGGVLILDGPSAGSLTTLPAPGAQGFPGYQPSDQVNPERDSFGLYYDMENQITSRLFASAAIRYENFSDFGDTLNGKVSGRVEATKNLAFRGSASTGFRAPSLGQSYYSQTATVFITGAPFEVRTFPVSSPVAQLLGATELKPEKSMHYSVGTTLQFGGNFSASVDAYEIYIDDRIAYSSNFQDAGVQTFLANNGYLGVTGARFFTNAIDTRTRGIDLTSRYLLKTPSWGNLVFTAGVNINQQKLTRVASTPPALAAVSTIPLIDRVETMRYEKGQPRNTINFAAMHQYKKWSFVVRQVRFGKITTVATATDPTRDHVLGAKWLTDINVGYQIFKRVTLNVGANNVFNVKPDKVLTVNNANGLNIYSNASPFGTNGGFYYMRVNCRL